MTLRRHDARRLVLRVVRLTDGDAHHEGGRDGDERREAVRAEIAHGDIIGRPDRSLNRVGRCVPVRFAVPRERAVTLPIVTTIPAQTVQPADDERAEQPVTPLELFFDLVLVFAITQVSGFISANPTWSRLAEGLAILAVLWWAWVSYAWLANSAASDEGAARVVLLAAMGALLITSLAVPKAFGADALTFGVAYFGVRMLHLGSYLVVARGDPELRGVVLRLAVPVVPAALLLVSRRRGRRHGSRAVLGARAGIDYGGLAMRGVDGWRVEPAHFAERHGLIMIIALGESIVALGVGAEGLALGAELIVAALLGIAAAGAMWWAYFDVAAIVAERRFKAMDRIGAGADGARLLHVPAPADGRRDHRLRRRR